VSVVDGAAHTQKDDVESNGGSLEGECCNVLVLFLCGVQLVLRSGVFTVLDLDEVDVTPRFAEVFGSMLSGVGGFAGGWQLESVHDAHCQRPKHTQTHCILHWKKDA
jgi:hypothetical protein